MNTAFGCDRAVEARLDRALAGLPVFSDAREVVLNPMLPAGFVLAASYAKSFPQHAFIATNGLQEDHYLMSPTCCYPVFRSLGGEILPGRSLITHKNICFRREAAYQEARRQGVFLMREYILLAEEVDTVRSWLSDVRDQVMRMLRGLGLAVSVARATDPFFDPNDLRQKFQEDQDLKSEITSGNLAIGSLNLHLQAMSRNCGIAGPSGRPLFTGCFGLGYDRVAGLLADPVEAAR